MRPLIRLFQIVIVISIAACATTDLPSSQWDNIVYEGLDLELRSMELPETADCGFYSLMNLKPQQRNRVVETQFSCAEKAMAMGKPFKFGHTWIPTDSTLTEIVITQKGQFLVRKIDVMLDGSDAQQQTLLCDKIRFNLDSMTIEHDGCATGADSI